ncbi:hypothetical protein ACP275_02G094300 [Erythranthe tilingii]
MAKTPSKHSRDLPQEFEGLLNNLQDWELSFKEKDKKLRSDAVSKGKLKDQLGQPSGNNVGRPYDSAKVHRKQTMEKTPSYENPSTVKQYDHLKEYEALSRLSSSVPSKESSVDANSEKELGNEFFKQKKFTEAIDCYSRSIALSPSAVAYANRAMAYIKIRRFQEAENDCTEALNLDDRYIKAYSRRSTARKELGKLKESMDDAEFALRLEPQNQEIKKQFAESKSLLEKAILKKVSGALTDSVEGAQPGKSGVDKNNNVQKPLSGRVTEILEENPKGNKVREVTAETSMEIKRNSVRSNGCDVITGSETAKLAQTKPKYSKQELKASVQELAAKAANLAKAEAAKNIVPPNSAYQFEVSWRGLSNDRNLQTRLLQVTSPAALPGIFKNALSAPILVDIIRCIATFFVEDMALAVDYLQNLTKIPRFDMIIMCLSSADKSDVSKIWDEVFIKGTADYGEILGDLRIRYGIKH